MRNTPRRVCLRGALEGLALLAGLLATSCAGRGSAPARPHFEPAGGDVPLSLYLGQYGAVEMRIGKAIGRFIVDTGADHTLVDVQIAEREGWALSDCKSLPGTTAGDMCRVALPSGELAGRAFPPVLGKTMDMRRSDLGRSLDADGILGADWLGRYTVVLDYPHARWALIDPAAFRAPAGAVEIPFELQGTIIFVPVTVNGVPAKFILDTGNSGNPIVLNVADRDRMISPAGRRLIFPKALRIAGGGTGDVAPGRAKLELGSLKLPDARVLVVPTGTGTGGYVMEHVDGILGVLTLKWFRVSIDYLHRRLYLEQLVPMRDERPATFGIIAQAHEGKLFVRALAQEGPAARAGIRVDDELLSIDGIAPRAENLAVLQAAVEANAIAQPRAFEVRTRDEAARTVRLVSIELP